MNTTIITTGEKLKAIRKKYKIKQYELSQNNFTRNLISMIETDKSNLTQNTAEILLKNIQKICKQKSVACDITLEYLLESAEDQAKKICKQFIDLITSSPELIYKDEIEKDLNEIQKLLDKYRLKEEKVTLYLELMHIFNTTLDCDKAYSYALRAFENYSNPYNDLRFIHLIIEITFACNHINKYKDTLNFVNLAYINMDNIPKDMLYKLIFNTIIAYRNSNQYDLALNEIIKIETTFSDDDDFYKNDRINIMILKANCYYGMLSYNDALDIHKEILSLTKSDTEAYFMTLCNIIEIYTILNDNKNVKEYIDICILNLKNYELLDNKRFPDQIYYYIGLGCKAINRPEISVIYFNKALKDAKRIKKIDIIVSSMENLLTIAINNKSEKEVSNLKNQLLEIISLKLLPINNPIIFKFIKHYIEQGDTDTIKDLTNFIETQSFVN